MPSENAYVCLYVQHTETNNPNFRLSDNYRIIADPQKAKATAEKLVKQLHQEYPDKRVIMQTEAINDDFSQEAPKNEQDAKHHCSKSRNESSNHPSNGICCTDWKIAFTNRKVIKTQVIHKKEGLSNAQESPI